MSFLAPICSNAQKQRLKIDSLQKILVNAKEDTDKIMIYHQLSSVYETVNADSGILIGVIGLKLAEQLGWGRGKGILNNDIGQNYKHKNDFRTAQYYYSNALINNKDNKPALAKTYDNKGVVYHTLGDYDSALFFHNQALNLFTELNDSAAIAEECAEVGSINFDKGDYDAAYENHFKALKIRQDLKDNYGIAQADNDIGIACYNQGNYDKARDYYLKALTVYQELYKKNPNSDLQFKIAICHTNMANLYNDQKKYDSALMYVEMSLPIFEEKNMNEYIVSNLVIFGNVNKNHNKNKAALENFFRALKLSKDNKAYSSICQGNIGEVYLAIYKDTAKLPKKDSLLMPTKDANLKKSIEYLSKALVISKEIDDKESIKEFSQYLSDAYKFSGNYKAAYDNYIEYSSVKDSLTSFNNKKSLTKFETAAQKEINEQNIKLDKLAVEKKRNEAKFLYIGMVLLLFIIGLVVRSNMKQNKSNKIITKEKKRSDELLLNILPAEVAEELKDKGSADAKYFEEVTVFFSDFVGFTKVAERMTPQQLVNELDACFKGFDHIMTKYNIEKIKTVGDAYLAVSGLPMGDPNHAEKIVKAAIEIRNFQLERKRQLGEMTFEVRIGAHSGSVVAGIVGVKKFAYDIWGDTVNTAARMEQNSQPGKINISENTYNRVKDKFECVFRGKIQAKNKGELSMYFVETMDIEEEVPA